MGSIDRVEAFIAEVRGHAKFIAAVAVDPTWDDKLSELRKADKLLHEAGVHSGYAVELLDELRAIVARTSTIKERLIALDHFADAIDVRKLDHEVVAGGGTTKFNWRH